MASFRDVTASRSGDASSCADCDQSAQLGLVKWGCANMVDVIAMQAGWKSNVLDDAKSLSQNHTV